jgi:hypothetical protein
VKQPPVLLKIAVILSSLLLVGGYVSYRAGALNWPIAPNGRPTGPAASQQSPSDTTQPATTLMPSSKVGVEFIDPPVSSRPEAQSLGVGTPRLKAIMSGPKSAAPSDVIIVFDPPLLPGIEPPAPSQPSKAAP